MNMNLKSNWMLLILLSMMALIGCSNQTKSLDGQQVKPIVACQKIEPPAFPVVAPIDSAKLNQLRAANDQAGIIKFLQDAYFKAMTSYTVGAYTYKALVLKVDGQQNCLVALDKKGLIIYQGK